MAGKKHHVHCNYCGAPHSVRMVDFKKKIPYVFLCTNCGKKTIPRTIESLLDEFIKKAIEGSSIDVGTQLGILRANFSDTSNVNYGNLGHILGSVCALLEGHFNAAMLGDVKLLIKNNLDSDPMTTMEEILLVLNG